MTTTMNGGLVPGSVLLALTALAVSPAALAQGTALLRLQAEDRAGGDLFACALDLDGTTLLVGSLLDDDRGADSGSAYVFELGPGDEGWRQSAKILAPDAAAGHRFGFAVALAGERALIGAPLAGAGGAVYQYEREPGGEGWRLVDRVGAAEGGADAGAALAFTPTRGLAGAPAADAAGRIDAGAVLAFSLDAPGGGAVERIAAREPQAGAGFGWALAASGGRAAVGAPWTDAPFTDSGAVHLLTESGAGLAETVRITAADARPFDAFGYAVALSGDLLAVGAPRAEGGAGAVYLFRLSGGGLALEARLAGPAPGAQLGTAVALEGELLAAGARLAAGPAGAAVGAVHLFGRQGGSWVEVERLQPAAARAGDEVGIDVDLSGGGLAAGAYRDDTGGADAGAAYTRVPLPVLQPAAADLAVTKTVAIPAGGAAAPPGSEVVFVVVVENFGPADAAGARVRDELPAGLAGATWTCRPRRGASCAGAGAGSIDERVDLRAGASVTYRITGTMAQDAAGPLVNLASVEPPPGLVDPEPEDDAAEATVPLGPVTADLYLDVRSLALEEGGAGVAVPGTPIVHELEIGNLGPSDAPPFGFGGGGFGPAFVAPTWTCAGSGGATCVPAAGAGPVAGTVTLPAGGAVLYVITATVSPAAAGSIVLAGGLGPLTGLDPNPANNADSVSTPVAPTGDLAVALSAPAASPPGFFSAPGPAGKAVVLPDDSVLLRPDETAIYEVRFANAGPSDARDAAVRVDLAPGLVPVGWQCLAGCAGSGEGPLPAAIDLPAGSERVYALTVAALAGFLGPREVTARIVPPKFFDDPDPTNNVDLDGGPVLIPADGVAATLEVVGTFVEGSTVTFLLTIANGGALPVADGPGDEASLPLSPALVPVGATATFGEVGIDPAAPPAPATVAWNGAIPPGGLVVIEIEAKILPGALGESVASQATAVDPEGGEVLSAPPGAAEPAPTIFVVASLLAIPGLSGWGLAALALLLAAAAVGFLGRTA
jgi:uncharacterized repeat protein (TIGR01451 family)